MERHRLETQRRAATTHGTPWRACTSVIAIDTKKWRRFGRHCITEVAASRYRHCGVTAKSRPRRPHTTTEKARRWKASQQTWEQLRLTTSGRKVLLQLASNPDVTQVLTEGILAFSGRSLPVCRSCRFQRPFGLVGRLAEAIPRSCTPLGEFLVKQRWRAG